MIKETQIILPTIPPAAAADQSTKTIKYKGGDQDHERKTFYPLQSQNNPSVVRIYGRSHLFIEVTYKKTREREREVLIWNLAKPPVSLAYHSALQLR